MLNKKVLIALMIVTFLGIMGLSKTLNYWDMSGEEGVSGDSLLIEVAETYQIPLEEIYAYWNIPAHVSPRTTVGEAKDIAGFATGKFKAWVVVNTSITELQKSSEEETHTELSEADAQKLAEAGIDIRASLTLKQIANDYKIPLELMYSKWGFTPGVSDGMKLKDLRESYGFEMDAFKLWVAENRQ